MMNDYLCSIKSQAIGIHAHLFFNSPYPHLTEIQRSHGLLQLHLFFSNPSYFLFNCGHLIISSTSNHIPPLLPPLSSLPRVMCPFQLYHHSLLFHHYLCLTHLCYHYDPTGATIMERVGYK